MIHTLKIPQKPSQELIDKFREQSSATVYEASGRKGYISNSVRPIARGVKICGPALTVQCAPGDNLMLHKAIEIAQPGDVIIATTGGACEYGYWGGLMAVSALSRKIGGLVIDGGVRDTSEIIEMGFPVFSRPFCIKGTTKNVLGLINYPLFFGGAFIEAGDIILGDDDGLVVVKQGECAEVLEKTIARVKAEEEKMKILGSGISSVEYNKLTDVFTKLGYKEE